MGKLERFLGKPKKVKISGEEIELKPLTISHLDIVMDLADDKKKTDAMKRLVITTLKRSFPDESDENIENFGLNHFESLSTAILEVNGLADKKKAVLEKSKE